jgi:hypothetical protein
MLSGFPSLIRSGLAFMIRDTFETNAGLCELFKRKIIERARFVGLSEDLIDFETQIDMKGTYQDNLRSFYREYPQLAQNSDYFRIKSLRPLSGAALDQSWRAYERNNRHELSELTRMATDQPPTAEPIIPELVITYTFGPESAIARKEAAIEPESNSTNAMLGQAEVDQAASAYRDLFRSILDCVTATAGEKVTKAILNRIGLENDGTAFNMNLSPRSLSCAHTYTKKPNS